MRLPVTPQISTKDGVSNKNARLTNVLKETRGTGDLAVIRPGLSLDTTYAGLGNGLIVFDGRLLVMVDDTIYDQEWDTYFPLDSDEWASGTTYSWGDFVWYLGGLWVSVYGGNIGNTPGASDYWERSYKPPDYSDSDTYDIGEPVTYSGVTYYSYSDSNSGNTPGTSSLWSTTPAPATRYQCTSVVYGPISATLDSAMDSWWPLFYATVEHSCPGVPPYYLWYDETHVRSGNAIFGNQYGTAGTRPCGHPLNGPYYTQIGTIYSV